MTCNGISGGNIGIHLNGHNTQVHGRNDNDEQTDGAFLTDASNNKNDFAAGLSEPFKEATDKKPGGIFT